MLYSGKKFRDKKNKYTNSRVVRKTFSEQNKPPPPLQVKRSVPKGLSSLIVILSMHLLCHGCHSFHLISLD